MSEPIERRPVEMVITEILKQAEDYSLLGDTVTRTWMEMLAGVLPVAKEEHEQARNSRETVARWMMENSFATGHGDTLEDLLKELQWQVVEQRFKLTKIRSAMASHGAFSDPEGTLRVIERALSS